MKTPIEIRKKIVAAGMWKSFTIRKDLLKLEGMPSGEASRTALLEFEMGTLPEVSSNLNHAMLMNKVKAGEALEYVEKTPLAIDMHVDVKKPAWSVPAPVIHVETLSGEEVKPSAPYLADKSPKRLPRSQPVALGGMTLAQSAFALEHPEFNTPVTSEEIEAFENLQIRRAGEIDIFRWVARNMEFVADVSTCPDPAAWGMLKQCHSSASFKATFWTTMYSKLIPTRSKLDSHAEERGAGESEIELLREIEIASEVIHAGE